MQTIYDIIENVARDLYWRALKDIPADVRAALRVGLETERRDRNSTAEQVMFTILENIKTADEHGMLVCQDTGLPVYKVVVGNRASIELLRWRNASECTQSGRGPYTIARKLGAGCGRPGVSSSG